MKKGKDSNAVKELTTEIMKIKRFAEVGSYEKDLDAEAKKIIRTPFLLKIVTDALPELKEGQGFTKARLYKQFTRMHFEHEKKKMEQSKNIPDKYDLVGSFYEFSVDLAINMYINDKVAVEAEGYSYGRKKDLSDQSYDFSRFFNPNDHKVYIAEQGAQLLRLEGTSKFQHKSIMEYFAARVFYEELKEFDPSDNTIKDLKIFFP